MSDRQKTCVCVLALLAFVALFRPLIAVGLLLCLLIVLGVASLFNLD